MWGTVYYRAVSGTIVTACSADIGWLYYRHRCCDLYKYSTVVMSKYTDVGDHWCRGYVTSLDIVVVSEYTDVG